MNTLRQLLVAPLALPLLLVGCIAPDGGEPESEPYTPREADEPATIGYFITSLDNQLKAWTNLKLGATSNKELRTLRSLERELNQSTSKRRGELLEQLESPSPKSRAVSAIALGFSGDPSVAGPILNALSDPDPLVVNNALVGLGVLASADTPLARVCYLLANNPDPWTRNNAAYAMAAVIAAGGRDECVLDSCRGGLIDAEGGVRAQSASILGMLSDVESVQPLGDLLFDDQMLVGRASAAALGTIGLKVLEEKGKIARLLVDAAPRVQPSLRNTILGELARMSTDNYGEDLELWTEWAYRLP
ncbi:MAG: HEAT repeat domain-containing protein [Planctomycetota bacterium]